MLKKEAIWFLKKSSEINNEQISPIINIGSNTMHFRKTVHPWVHYHLFNPIQQRGIKVFHTDILEEEGVDLSGDLQDKNFLNKLESMNFKSVFCNHLFEHVNNKEAVAKSIEKIIPPGGYLFISCPYKFPYHPGPIDNMFRPDANEVLELFQNCEIVTDVIVKEPVIIYLLRRLITNPFGVLKKFMRKSKDIKNTDVPSASTKTFLFWVFKSFSSTCVVLKKK